MRPSPSSTSISSAPSCTSPWRCEEDSMPTPASAPPSVIVFSCGTTAGITPCGRHASTSASYGIMPSHSTKSLLTWMTSLKLRTSSRRRGAAARSRNRFDVSFCRATVPWAALSCAARESFFCGEPGGIEEVARHRVAGARDVALREHHLEEVGLRDGRAEHLGTAVEIDPPDAAKALVEALRIERADALPVAVEALGPMIERDGVVTAQVLDVEHLEAGLLHFHDDVGEARDPAAGEHVLADEVVGLVLADVADEVDQAEPALLQQLRVRADHFGELVAAGVLEAADRYDLVELARRGAEILVRLHRVLEAALLDLPARVLGLRAGGVDAGDANAVALGSMEQETAKAAADVDHIVARLQQHLARDVV